MNNEDNPGWPWGFVDPNDKKDEEQPPIEEKKETRGAPKGEGHTSPSKDDLAGGISYLKRKADAKALYIQGFSLKTISKEINVPSNVINKWADTENWKVERDEYLDRNTIDTIEEYRANQELTLEHLNKIKKTSMDSIEEKKVAPKKFQEAVSAYVQAEEIQRKIKVESIQIKFLIDVAKVLREEITDEDLLKRIGDRLSKLYRKEQVNAAQESKLLVAPEEDTIDGTEE